MKKNLTFILVLLSLTCFAQKEGLNSIDRESIKVHMAFFASDEMQGREAGTSTNDVSALYIMTNLMRMGVKGIPGPAGYFQDIPLQRTRSESTISMVSGNSTFSNDSIILLMPTAQEVQTTAGIVFAGYGVDDSGNGYNDFEGIELADKIVLVMTGSPQSVLKGEGRDEVFPADLERKLGSIFMRKPKAIFVVYNGASKFRNVYESGAKEMLGSERLTLEGSEMRGLPIQIGFLTRNTADQLLKPAGHSIKELTEKIRATGKPASFVAEGVTATVTTKLLKDAVKSRNVIGIIEGSDPVLKDECIVYTAHFDHVGIQNGEVYNGADDNASGSIALLEMADAFMKLRKKPLRTIIFAWVNAEEKGLLGSRYYVEHPVMPLNNTLLNINLDMVGRTKMASDTGTFYGSKLSVTGPSELEYYSRHESTQLNDIINESALAAGIKLIDKGADLEAGGSDHMSFWGKGVSAVMFHSGIHADLHGPGDDNERIDFEKMEKSAKMCFLIGYKIATQKPRFVVDKPEKMKSGSPMGF